MEDQVRKSAPDVLVVLYSVWFVLVSLALIVSNAHA